MGGPCLSLASWPTPPLTASERSNVADLGGNGFGPFPGRKGFRLQGRNPATDILLGPQTTYLVADLFILNSWATFR